ncbi:MAG: hypothetical protein AB8I08_25535 [Sandaracinaceae bacterium]
MALVAEPVRRARLRPWLRVVGEPVSYRRIDVTPASFEQDDPRRSPEALVLGGPLAQLAAADVIVLDGRSLPSATARTSLLRAAQSPRFRYATVLYLEASADDASVGALSADDVVPVGPEQDARLGRLVQAVALAPWKHAERIKTRAKALGDQRLRELPGGRRPALLEPGEMLAEAPGMGPHLARWLMESVRVGRAAGAEAAFKQVAALCAEYAEEIEFVQSGFGESHTPFDGPASPEALEASHRLQGAGDAVVTLQEAIRGTARSMREALEPNPSSLVIGRTDGMVTGPSDEPG